MDEVASGTGVGRGNATEAESDRDCHDQGHPRTP